MKRHLDQRLFTPDKMNIVNYATKCYCAVNRVKTRQHFSKIIYILVALMCFLEISVVRGDQRLGKKNTSGETTTDCPDCHNTRENKKELAVGNIKVKILSAMGLTDVPQYSKRMYPPLNQLIGLYDSEIPHPPHSQHRHKNMNVVDDYEDDDKIKLASEIIEGEPYDLDDEGIKIKKEIHGAEPCLSCSKFEGQRPVVFKLDKSMMHNEYHVIKLMLYSNSSQYCKDEDVNITIYKLTQGSGQKESYKLIRTTEKKVEEDSWIRIEFKDIILNHMDNTKEVNNITLVITATYRKLPPPECSEFSKNIVFHPVLEFQFKEKTNKRSKRASAQDCNENGNSTNCCRYPLTIDFDEFKWDFIIAPRRYEAYYCFGECPPMYKQSTPHTHLANMAAKFKGGPCCSPKKMSSISMLYFTQKGTILFGRISGMVVEKCGCS